MKKLLGALLLLFGCAGNYPELPVVEHVVLEKYIGKWYEIASFPQSFQKGCNCSTAEYFLTDEGYIRVLNSCRKGSVNGELKTAEGKAYVEDEKTNAKLSVQFFWPFKGDYWIIELAEDYSWVVVGHPNREYLWILSRSPKMDTALYNSILGKVKLKGFDISKLQITIQECN